MSKQNIIDICAALFIAIFLVAIYLVPPLKDAFVQILCGPEMYIAKTKGCSSGILLLYVIPTLSAMALVVRFFTKVSKNV